MRRLFLGIFAGLLALPTAALASGYTFPENGARPLVEGGAGAGWATDPSAIFMNPAGLTGLGGVQLILDSRLNYYDMRFQRRVDDGSGTLIDQGDEVQNAAQPWYAPTIALSWTLDKKLSFALGVFGPSANGRSEYPDPRKISPELYDRDPSNDPDGADIVAGAPQRYSLIHVGTVIAYPSLAVAYAPTEWLSLGVTAQAVMGTFSSSRAIYGGLIAGESPVFDAIADMELTIQPTFAYLLGAQVSPLPWLKIGASVRPGFTVNYEGDLKLTFSDTLVDLGVEQTATAASFSNDFPTVVRVGVGAEAKGYRGAIDVVYEGWSVVDAFRLDPHGVEVWFGDVSLPIEEIVITKDWHDTVGVRLGGSVDLKAAYGLSLPVSVHAGVNYDPSASATKTLGLDFVTGDRTQYSLGASWDQGPIGVTLGFSQILQGTIDVSDSEMRQTVSPPEGISYEGSVVGNGRYEFTNTLFTLGLRGRFGS